MLFTVGHYNHPPAAFAALLTGNGVTTLADARKFPGSRRSPWFGLTMPEWVPEFGVTYWHTPDLGGRRPKSKTPLDTDDIWRVTGFRNYAAHTRTPEFADALAQLLDRAACEHVAVMCGEPMWWRCHRRVIADLAVVRGLEVRHILPTGKTAEHSVSEWASTVHAA